MICHKDREVRTNKADDFDNDLEPVFLNSLLVFVKVESLHASMNLL